MTGWILQHGHAPQNPNTCHGVPRLISEDTVPMMDGNTAYGLGMLNCSRSYLAHVINPSLATENISAEVQQPTTNIMSPAPPLHLL